MQPMTRSFDLVHSSINDEERTIEFNFSSETEEVVRDFGGELAVEILSHADGDIDLRRLKNKAAFLMDHQSADQRGVVEFAGVSSKTGQAKVRLSKSVRGEELWQDMKDGIRTKISVGYSLLSASYAGKRSDGMAKYRVKWRPFELSSVSIAADDSVGVRDATSIFGLRAAQLSTQIIMEKSEAQTEEVRAVAPAVAPEKPAVDVAPVVTRSAEQLENDKVIEAARLEKRAAEIARLEIDRQTEIRDMGTEFDISAEDIKDALKRGATVDDFRAAIVGKLRDGSASYTMPKATADIPDADVGTRAHTENAWGNAAKLALGARGAGLQIPSRVQVISEGRNYLTGNGGVTFHRSMAGSLTLLDVAKSDLGIGYPVIEEAVQMIPEIGIFPTDTIIGDTISLSVRTTKGTASFRNANEGTTPQKAEFESRVFQTGIVSEFINVDIQGVLNASRDPGRFLLNQTVARTKDVLEHVAVQSWYGGTAMSSDTKAPPGLLAQSSTAATHVLDATGSTAKTSVWILELGQYSLDHVYGNDSTFSFSDWIEVTHQDAIGNSLRVLQNWIEGRITPRLANKNAAIRVKNVGTDSGKGLTDILLAQAFQKAREIGMKPNAIFMTPRSQSQLQVSRTTYNPTGSPSPLPQEHLGVPIYSTINLSNAETV